MLVVSETFPTKYKGGVRRASSGYSNKPEPTFTIGKRTSATQLEGYTWSYGCDRTPGKIQMPKFKSPLKEGPIENGDWEEICLLGRKTFKKIGKLKPEFQHETLEASKHLV